MKTRMFASPSRYVQGENVFKSPKKYMENLGNKPLLICDDFVWEIIGKELSKSMIDDGFTVKREGFNGESSEEEISRIVDVAKSEESDFIIGLGGGKAIDTVKNVADQIGFPVAALPTVASTDAPCSALSVIYTPDGKFSKYAFYDKNPDLVLVDTRVIANSPTRLLVAGIGDAMATNIEAQDVARGYNKSMLWEAPTLASLAIAQTCADNLFKHGAEAVAAVNGNVVTQALETVVESNTLLSGLGFESSGLAAAHAIHNGLTELKVDGKKILHGEKVAYGYLCELMLDNVPSEELDKFIKFNQKIGLPTTLDDLNLGDVNQDDLLKVGEQATIKDETIHEMPFEVSAEDVVGAMVSVDQYVKNNFQK